ncbi:MAG: lipopolysaccharide core heptose(II) kinase RfaY [Pseudomonadota bacterium]
MKYATLGLAKAGIDLVPPFSVDVRLDPVLVELAGDISAGDPPREVLDDSPTPLEFVVVNRVLPGRRLSGLVQDLTGARYFAKVFYGRGARRYWLRELHGAKTLAASKVQTPTLVNQGATADGEGYVVLYQAVEETCTLDMTNVQQWQSAVAQLARLHEQRVVHEDPHADNFLWQDGKVWIIDADGVRPGKNLRAQFNNLGTFLAQRAPIYDQEIEALLMIYLQFRDASISGKLSATDLLGYTRRQRRLRVNRYLKKTQRTCTEFLRKKVWRREFICQRSAWSDLQRFMWFPEEYLGDGTPLKLGNSATVVRVRIDQSTYIVKRYNVKSLSHRIRRWFKRRARLSWINGHHLDFLDIATAKPVALLELKWGWFVGTCYLVMPDVGDVALPEVDVSEAAVFDQICGDVIELLKQLKAAQLEHGDLKATNLMYGRSARSNHLTLIDYDGLKSMSHDDQHRNRDTQRFLDNWVDDADVHRRWNEALQEAGL